MEIPTPYRLNSGTAKPKNFKIAQLQGNSVSLSFALSLTVSEISANLKFLNLLKLFKFYLFKIFRNVQKMFCCDH